MLQKSSYTHVKYSCSEGKKTPPAPFFRPFSISQNFLGNGKSGQVRFLYPIALAMFHFPPFPIRMCVQYSLVVCQRISIPPKTFASLLAPCFWFYRHRLQHFGEQAAETCLYSQPDGPMYCQTEALSKHLCTRLHLKMFFGGGM